MLDGIRQLLKKSPNLKGKAIAKKIDSNKKVVNAFLHQHPDDFIQDENFFWSLVESELLIELLPKWMDCNDFEKCLTKAGSPIDSDCSLVTFILPKSCRPMIDVIARLLALCNQLVADKKKVQLDFSQNKGTLAYFDRLGFLDHLNIDIDILPDRPKASRAKAYRGNNKAIVEIGAVDPNDSNRILVSKLTDSFVAQSSGDYETVAFTIFSELIGNVKEHSLSPLTGFAGLQKYEGNRKHIQTVISDSGAGIFNTLKDIIPTNYPQFHNYQNEDDYDIYVVDAVMTKGEISRHGSEEGRGLGFKSSREQAKKFDATLTIRQQNFSLIIRYKNGRRLPTIRKTDLVTIRGTHLCFDFMVD